MTTQEAAPGGPRRLPRVPGTERVKLLHIWCRFVDFPGSCDPPSWGPDDHMLDISPWVAQTRANTWVHNAPERGKRENTWVPNAPERV